MHPFTGDTARRIFVVSVFALGKDLGLGCEGRSFGAAGATKIVTNSLGLVASLLQQDNRHAMRCQVAMLSSTNQLQQDFQHAEHCRIKWRRFLRRYPHGSNVHSFRWHFNERY